MIGIANHGQSGFSSFKTFGSHLSGVEVLNPGLALNQA